MTQNQEEKEVKSCCQGEENACGEGCACGAEGEHAAEGQAEAATPDTVETLQTALKLAEAKVIEHYDLYVRAMAELENTRRRASEEVQKAHKFGIEKFAENLLPVVDSLEKALEVTKDDQDNPMREGMLATYRQLVHALDVSGTRTPGSAGVRPAQAPGDRDGARARRRRRRERRRGVPARLADQRTRAPSRDGERRAGLISLRVHPHLKREKGVLRQGGRLFVDGTP